MKQWVDNENKTMDAMADTDSSSDSKASSAQLRKIKKPIIERRRRERINDSLNQVKTLVLDALNKDESRFSKMEKADILEMTVKHLKTVQKHQQQQQGTSPQSVSMLSAASRYKAGFSECAHEVQRYLATVDGLNPKVHERLMGHLETVSRHAGSTKTVATTERTESKCLTSGAPVTVGSTGHMSGKVPILPLRLGGNVTVASSAVAASRNVSILPLTSNNSNMPTVIHSNLNAALPVQTYTLSGTNTARVLLTSSAQAIAMPTTVTLIREQLTEQSQVVSGPSAVGGQGTAIPLYINTAQLNPGVAISPHSPGVSDGESACSFSPMSTASNTSSGTLHWAPPPPESLPAQTKHQQPPSQGCGPVWRPW